MTQKTRDLIQVTWMYLLVTALGWGVVSSLSQGLIMRAAVADVVMTMGIFGFSLWKNNSSTYDAYWSVIPFLLVVLLFAEHAGLQWNYWQWGIMAVVTAWAIRLTANWARGWTGWVHEDWRYVDFRTKQGALFQLTNFFGIHLFPTAIVFLACLPLFVIAQAQTFHSGLMLLGIVVGTLGVALELISDNQLHAFRQRTDRTPGELLNAGLWAKIRYPNYLGEMLFWWGIALCGLGAGADSWMLSGALAMMVMFLAVTIPMKDQRMLSRYPDFEHYYQTVPALIPGIGR